jgi:hypothetical protein
VPGFVAGSGGKRLRGQGRDDHADGVPDEAPAPLLQAVDAGGGAVLTDNDDLCGMRNGLRDVQAPPRPPQPILPASRDTSGGRQEGIGGGDKGARVARTESVEEKASSAGLGRRGLQQVVQQVRILKINASTLIRNTKSKRRT